MKNKLLLLLLAGMTLLSCGEKKKQMSFYDNSDMESDSIDAASDNDATYDTADDVVVPFVEQGGVKYIDVTVNGQITVKMILDSGCSGTLISIAEAQYLYEKGCFSSDDILGATQSQIADGSIVENMVIRLRELVIGGKISCPDVTATVSANAQAPLLLGNEVLNRMPSYSVDNQNKVIKFKLNQ